MIYQDVYKMIDGTPNKDAVVIITGESGDKTYKQRLKIIGGWLKIKLPTSKAIGYPVTDYMCEKWRKVVIKKEL